jgi:hypothetical protein
MKNVVVVVCLRHELKGVDFGGRIVIERARGSIVG